MFDGKYLHAAFSQRRASCRIDDIIDIGFNNRLILKVNTAKTDACVSGRRVEGQDATLTGVKTSSSYANFALECTLFVCHKIVFRGVCPQKSGKISEKSHKTKKNLFWVGRERITLT